VSSKQYQLRYLPIFYDDLSNAVEYIRSFLKNPQAAEKLIDKVENAISKRSNCAESFEPYPSTRNRENPYYAIYVDNYIIFYVVLNHKIMEVRRFLYKGQNKDNIL
jgi:plasmid stabilization system protein ParE